MQHEVGWSMMSAHDEVLACCAKGNYSSKVTNTLGLVVISVYSLVLSLYD